MKRLVWLLLVVNVSAAWAQPGPPPQKGERWNRDQVETVIIGKFSSELNLTPEQATQFFPRFRQFQNQVDELQRQQADRRQELDKLAQDPAAPPARVNQLLAEQTEHMQRIAGLKQQLLTDVSTFLTPQQVSRCSILMDDLPRKVHQYIEQQRGGPGYGRGPNGQMPSDRRNGPRRRGRY